MKFSLLLSLSVTSMACFDLAAPPVRPLVAGYALQRILEETILLVRDPLPIARQDGGVLGGEVLDIGFDSETVIARVRANVGLKVGWWILSIKSGKLEGPIPEERFELRRRSDESVRAIGTEGVFDVWNRLPG